MMLRQFGVPYTNSMLIAFDNAKQLIGAAKYNNMFHLPSIVWFSSSLVLWFSSYLLFWSSSCLFSRFATPHVL